MKSLEKKNNDTERKINLNLIKTKRIDEKKELIHNEWNE